MRRRLFLEWLVRLVGTLWVGSGLYALWRFLRVSGRMGGPG